MADLPGAVTDIEASLVASLRREEEAAAEGLARSLVNDLDLTRALRRLEGPELLLADGRASSVREVASDHFLGAGPNPACVPFSHATLRGRLERSAEGLPSEARVRTDSDVTLLERLREWADEDVDVRVTTAAGAVQEGILARATPDHIAIQRMGREVCIAWGAVLEVKALGGLQPLSLEDRG